MIDFFCLGAGTDDEPADGGSGDVSTVVVTLISNQRVTIIRLFSWELFLAHDTHALT
jgi:hypothetical protein